MRQRWSISVTVAICVLVLAPAAYGQGNSTKSPPPVPVTSQVHDFDETSFGLLLRSDGGGRYESTAGVVSEISGTNGDWELDLSAQTARAIDLTFVTVDGSLAAVPSGAYNGRLMSRCFDGDGAITGFFRIDEGTSHDRCALRVNFTANGSQYFLVMSPLYEGTSWVTVSCPDDSDANTSCERWAVAPGPTSATPVAALYERRRSGKETFVGFYELTFAIDVTKQ